MWKVQNCDNPFHLTNHSIDAVQFYRIEFMIQIFRINILNRIETNSGRLAKGCLKSMYSIQLTIIVYNKWIILCCIKHEPIQIQIQIQIGTKTPVCVVFYFLECLSYHGHGYGHGHNGTLECEWKQRAIRYAWFELVKLIQPNASSNFLFKLYAVKICDEKWVKTILPALLTTIDFIWTGSREQNRKTHHSLKWAA